MWKFSSPFHDFKNKLNKAPRLKAGPNKIIVLACWVLVLSALILAFLKIVFRVF